MDINTQQAQETLDTVQATMQRASRSIYSSFANPLLILWGALWVAAYTTSHFHLKHVATIMWGMSIIGSIGTFLIYKMYWPNAPVKTSNNILNKKVGLMWFFVYLFVAALMFILKPFSGMQLNAALVTACMLAYVIMGLWFSNRSLIAIGLAVTIATLIGVEFFKPYYCLWMAATGGIALLLTGLYIRLEWR